METFVNSDPDAWRAAARRKRRRVRAFSLVEIALALGIMAFSLVAVFGLMPLGLSSFRKAMDLSIGSQVAQQVLDDAQQSDFDSLVNGQSSPFSKQPIRYFDAQGAELKTLQAGVIYWANTRVSPSTSMPSTDSAGNAAVNPDIATVSVQVANNPGGKPLTVDGTGLWPASSGVPMSTFSTYIARNSPKSASSAQ